MVPLFCSGIFDFIVAAPAAPLRPTAVWYLSDTSPTQPLSLIALCATRERTGLLSAAPAGAALWPGMVLRSSRLHFRERHGDGESHGIAHHRRHRLDRGKLKSKRHNSRRNSLKRHGWVSILGISPLLLSLPRGGIPRSRSRGQGVSGVVAAWVNPASIASEPAGHLPQWTQRSQRKKGLLPQRTLRAGGCVQNEQKGIA